MMRYPLWIKIGWSVMMLYWIVSSFGNKSSQKKEPPGSRVYILILYFLGALFLFTPYLQIGGIVIYPQGILSRLMGCLLCYIGLIFAVWARMILGRSHDEGKFYRRIPGACTESEISIAPLYLLTKKR